MEVTKLTMLRLKGSKIAGNQQNLFEAFNSFNGKFGAELKRITESGGFFEVFYLLPNEENKRTLKKHIARKYSVTEEPVIALKIVDADDITEVFKKMEMKAKNMRGAVAKAGQNNNHEGTIVLTFEKQNKCSRFGMWAVTMIR